MLRDDDENLLIARLEEGSRQDGSGVVNALTMQYTDKYIDFSADYCGGVTSSRDERVRTRGGDEAVA